MEQATAISHIAFRDPQAAARNLERVAVRASAGVLDTLPNLLAVSPDPDSALNLFERLCREGTDETLRLLDRHRGLVHYALAIFGYSPFLGETLIQNPDLLQQLSREKNLDRSHSREDFEESLARYRTRTFEADTALALARFKKREYIRITLRDVLGLATLAEATAEISALADVLIAEALRRADSALRKRYGPPRHEDSQGRTVETPFAVLALGKLGGNELNYSSDVDLMFLHGDGESAFAGEVSNREFFIRLAQHTTEILSRLTPEGPVFRIDLRLRPQGSEGEPAVSLSRALGYYSDVAHDWELQAMIKARHAAGDLALAREFLRGVQAHVYRTQLNFVAIETALLAREKISAHRRARATKAKGVDVKLDRGGIRDIEFLVQCLQRVYGGEERWLRSGGTLFSLQKLHDKGHLSGKDFHDLNSGYEFLRRVEHRLQLRQGQQTHRLPPGAADLRILARLVAGPRAAQSREGVEDEVRRRMAAVAEIYQRVIHRQHLPKRDDQGTEFRLRATAAAESGREQSFRQILEQLAADCPPLHEIAARRDLASHTRRNLQRFLSAALTSSERYAAVSRAPRAVEQALQLFAVSDGLTEILIRHPEEIQTLEGLGQPDRAEDAERLFAEALGRSGAARDPVFAHIGSAKTEHGERMALLRRHSRHRVFAAGARDLAAPRSVYESLEELTEAADDAVAAAMRIAAPPAQFTVLALGRLGSREFDIGSDADLLFLREERLDARKAARTAEQIVEALAAYTRDGTVFAVDPRLRPRGAEGELVVTPTHLASYFAGEAQPWEALTYTKLRFVTGSERLAERAIAGVEQGSARFAGDPGFAAAVREMRGKLERAESTEPGNFKTGPGGFYDIDFVASYLMVRSGTRIPGNIRERLHGLAAQGLLSDNDCATLDSAAELLRTLEHVVRLVTGRPRKSLPASEHARETVERLTRKLLRRDFAGSLEAELARAGAAVRETYERILASPAA